MAAETPTKEPETVRAGDTIKWKKSVSDYAASDGWANCKSTPLATAFQKIGNVFNTHF